MKPRPKYRLGTRKSALATVQSGLVRDALAIHGAPAELVLVESEGDQDRTTPLYEIEAATPGLFTKSLETALLENRIDLAVHSLKDLPTTQPKGLVVAAIPKRVISEDILLVRAAAFTKGESLNLIAKARVGTSSLRREAQLLAEREDLLVSPIRGNVPTRVAALRDGKFDAIVLAAAGLFRLGLEIPDDLVSVPLPEHTFTPAPGQGALAVETRTDRPADLTSALSAIHDANSAQETRIERRILKDLHGGCTLPLGVRCRVTGDVISLRGFLGISRERKQKNREWTGFHRFDISDTSEETLVRKTVSFFKEVMK